MSMGVLKSVMSVVQTNGELVTEYMSTHMYLTPFCWFYQYPEGIYEWKNEISPHGLNLIAICSVTTPVAVILQYLCRLCAALGCDGDVGLGGCGAGGVSGWHWWRGFLIGGDAR